MKKTKKKNKFEMKMSRRQVLKAGLYGGAGLMLPWKFFPNKAFAEPAAAGLSDPALQPKFVELAPNALDPAFLFKDLNVDGLPAQKPNFSIRAAATKQETGLINPRNGQRLKTNVWGYGNDTVSWPGQTIQVMSTSAGGDPETVVRWSNELGNKHLLPIDTSLHWCYSLHGYTQYSIRRNGVPIITHLHGGNSDFLFDGNPEFFYSPDGDIKGPQWFTDAAQAEGGFTTTFRYNNGVPAGNLWYHDHALGITRMNVYAGLAGFYFVRDESDTGIVGNPLGLPAFPYELAYAIQDRMFTDSGALFYSAFPGDPFYNDFITGEGVVLPPEIFPGGGPTALAEFFGDHMVVNGKIWPKTDVEPRNYRMRLLNGCDSRFLVIRFREVPADATALYTYNPDTGVPELNEGVGAPIKFTVIGSDQGLGSTTKEVDTLVFETGSRYDIIFDFSKVTYGKRVIMENIGGDTPFGFSYGDGLDYENDVFPNRQTDRIMAFDVNQTLDETVVVDVAPAAVALSAYATDRKDNYSNYDLGSPDRTRKVALFEGTDEFGRLQPILGTAEPATDFAKKPITWPDKEPYISAGLTGTIEGAIAWHSPTTENPAEGDTEVWEVYNVTGDSHPVHLHLVHFEVIGRKAIKWHDGEEGITFAAGSEPDTPNGTYLVEQPVIQHNSTTDPATWGSGFKVVNATYEGPYINPGDEYVDATSPKDMVTARPGEVTFIKCKFDKPGRYVWHCHILSHEDHEMMRVLHVGPGA
jgi:FtsP/CotA-like multicopper oxidase with cupredoxin domain